MNFKFYLHHLLFFYTVLAGAIGAAATAPGKPIYRTERAFMDDKKASNSENKLQTKQLNFHSVSLELC
jgi:hypothetical protein